MAETTGGRRFLLLLLLFFIPPVFRIKERVARRENGMPTDVSSEKVLSRPSVWNAFLIFLIFFYHAL